MGIIIVIASPVAAFQNPSRRCRFEIHLAGGNMGPCATRSTRRFRLMYGTYPRFRIVEGWTTHAQNL